VDTLTHEWALRQALASNPRLRAAALEIDARRALTRQADRISNPFLDAEAENVSSNGPEDAITTVLLGQLVEVGGDRLARHRLARIESNRAVLDATIESLFIRGVTRVRFAEASAAQARSRLARTQRALADTILAATREQVLAGDRSPIDQTRAEILLAEARTEVEKADAEQWAAYVRLAAVWAGTPDFEAVAPLPAPEPIPSLDSLLAALPHSASIAVWEIEAERSAAILRLEQARRIPDITLSAGYRRFTVTGDGALVGRLNLPIPLFNRNQGSVEAARFRFLAVEADQAAAVSEMRAVLADLHAAMLSAYTEAESLRLEVIPRASEVTKRIEEGYRAGRFSLLDVLDAQRTLTAASARYQEALARYYTTAADIERLTSLPLEPIE
jgi:cobalt-zinc-cadmium efflux system outer membrane protein